MRSRALSLFDLLEPGFLDSSRIKPAGVWNDRLQAGEGHEWRSCVTETKAVLVPEVLVCLSRDTSDQLVQSRKQKL
jgi:hypothetical protein